MAARKQLANAVIRATGGSPAAVDDIFTACYDELRRLAHKCLAGERPGHTLQTTALVHEAYVRLVDGSRLNLKNRAHFFAVAARVMRHVLVDYARRRHFAKRVELEHSVSLDAALSVSDATLNDDLVALDLALSRLQKEIPDKIRIVEMRFFGGMTYDEVSDVLGVPSRTLRRHASYAQARLYEMMRGD